MAKKSTPTTSDVAAAFRLIADWIESGEGVTSTSGGDVEKLNEDDVRALPLLELRKLAVELELDEQKVKKGILEEIAAKGLFEDSDEDDEDEEEEDDEEGEGDTSDEDEEDGEEEEEEELTREDLEEMSLADLRKLAKDEGHPRGSYIKADKDALVDLLIGDDEEEDDEEDGEEEEEELDEETIRGMSLAEVKKLATELGVKVPAAIAKNRKKIADKILDEMAEEE